jgi:hypothetical protein
MKTVQPMFGWARFKQASAGLSRGLAFGIRTKLNLGFSIHKCNFEKVLSTAVRKPQFELSRFSNRILDLGRS